MKRRYYLCTVILVLAIWIAILVRTDLRNFPQPTGKTLLDGSWAQRAETYLSECIGFHDTLFRFKTQIDLFIGEKLIRDVYVTDDMLLEKITAQESINIPASASVLNQFYEKYQIPTCFILVPSASEIYEERLPANAVKEEQETLIREIYANVRTGIRCVDAHNILSSQKEEYIYYRTDTRWTSYGAYCVYQSAIQKMGFTAVPYNRYVISHMSTDFKGDLYQRTLYDGVQADVLDCYNYESGGAILRITAHHADGSAEERTPSLYDMSALQTPEMYDFYLGEPCAVLRIQTDLENGKKLLIYKDDFADCMIPFLMQHYSEICIIDLEQSTEISMRMADPSEFTQVLFLCSMEGWSELWAFMQ